MFLYQHYYPITVKLVDSIDKQNDVNAYCQFCDKITRGFRIIKSFYCFEAPNGLHHNDDPEVIAYYKVRDGGLS